MEWKRGDTNKSFTDEVTSQLQPLKQDAQQMQGVRSRIALEGVSIPPQGPSTGQFSAWDISMAIRDIFDMCERTMINFLALGEFGRAVRERQESLLTDHLEIGMFARNETAEIKSLFKTWGFEKTKYGYKYYFTPPTKWDIKIPVEVHVIRRNYKFFSNPDIGWFGVDDFRIPNPFDKYWKTRHLIQ